MLRVVFLIIALCIAQARPVDSTSRTLVPTLDIFPKTITCSSSVKKFLDKLANLESGNSISSISSTGYLGKYQFSLNTVKGLGFDVTQEEFLRNEFLQDSAALALMHYNKRILHKYIKEYEGQTIDSVHVTKAGLLAGAHLVGAGGVISFLTNDTTHATEDGNGVSVKKYLQLFSKYQLKGI